MNIYLFQCSFVLVFLAPCVDIVCLYTDNWLQKEEKHCQKSDNKKIQRGKIKVMTAKFHCLEKLLNDLHTSSLLPNYL